MLIKKRYAVVFAIVLLMGIPNSSYAEENSCPYEKAFKDEYVPLNKKSLAQTTFLLDLTDQIQKINEKAAANGAKKDEPMANSLSIEDNAHYTQLTTQLSAATVELVLIARRLQDLGAVDKFVHIAQKEFAGTAPNLSNKEISDYTEQMRNDDPFLSGYDNEKVHELFLEYFAKEIVEKKIGSADPVGSEGCNLDKALASLIVEIGKQIPADNGESLSSKFKLMAQKYATPDGQHIDENKLSISDKNVLADLNEQRRTLGRETAFVTRLEAIRNVNRISSAMYGLSNEDLLKSGGSGDLVAKHDFYKDFPEQDHGFLDLLVRLNDKLPSKAITDLSKSTADQKKSANSVY